MVGDGTVTFRSLIELSLFGISILLVVVASHLLGVIALYRLSARRNGESSKPDGVWAGYGETISEGCSVRVALAIMAFGVGLLLSAMFLLG